MKKFIKKGNKQMKRTAIYLIIVGLIFGIVSLANATDFFTIRNNMENMTKVQWKEYSKSLEDTYLSGCGHVVNVKEQLWGGYTVEIDMDEPDTLSVQDIYMKSTSESQAANLNKGQNVCFSGNIDRVTNVFGMSCAVTIKKGTIN